MSFADWGKESGGIFAGGDDFGGGGLGSMFAGADWLSAGSNVLGQALKPSSGVSSATSIQRVEAPFDSSNWIVSLGGSKVDATQSNTTDRTDGFALPSGNALMYGGLAILVLYLWKQSRK
jgi:hypothetical protein